MYMFPVNQVKTLALLCIVLVCIGDLNSASCAASVAQLVELQPRTLKVVGSSPTRGSFERLLPWDLICISFLCLSQVSEYLSCTVYNTKCFFVCYCTCMQ